MIINSLCKLYDLISSEADSEIPLKGYSRVKVSFALILSEDGDLLNIADLRERDSKGRILSIPYMTVPEQSGRSGTGAKPYKLCDNCTYVLGISKDKREDAIKKFEAFKKMHLSFLGNCKDPYAISIVNFLNKWKPDIAEDNSLIKNLGKELYTGSIVFKLEGYSGYAHDREEIKKLLLEKADKSNYYSQCLVTGEKAFISEIHNKIKGVASQDSALIAINSSATDAYDSYGKTKAFNAPISEDAVFKYTTALNYLISSSSSCIKIGDDTIVYWAESNKKIYNELANFLLSPNFKEIERENRDKDKEYLIRDILNCVKNGTPIKNVDIQIDDNVKFYILCLSPNAGRIAIRYFYVNSFGNFIKNFSQHYSDMEIDGGRDFTSLWQLLNETVPKKSKNKKPSPIVGGQVLNSIISGAPYPYTLYSNILIRTRTEPDDRDKKIYSVNSIRASFIKAFLLRNERKLNYKKYGEVLQVSLNEKSKNQAYLLGRLFALLERAQENASSGNLNTTIKDRYFSTASASPVTVFPSLLRLTQHHLAKIDNSKWIEIKIGEVMDGIDTFPSHLNLEEQGIFILGYYHQRQDFFKKKND